MNLFGTYDVMSHAAVGMGDLDPLDGGDGCVIVNAASAASG